jgi:hypothetical protein
VSAQSTPEPGRGAEQFRARQQALLQQDQPSIEDLVGELARDRHGTYWLARAQEALGVADARRNYEQYAALRGGAEPSDPLVVDARARLDAKIR